MLDQDPFYFFFIFYLFIFWIVTDKFVRLAMLEQMGPGLRPCVYKTFHVQESILAIKQCFIIIIIIIIITIHK